MFLEAAMVLHYIFSDKVADWNAHVKITCHFRKTQSLYKNLIKLGPSRMTYLLINSKLTGLGLEFYMWTFFTSAKFYYLEAGLGFCLRVEDKAYWRDEQQE